MQVPEKFPFILSLFCLILDLEKTSLPPLVSKPAVYRNLDAPNASTEVVKRNKTEINSDL